MMGPWVLLLLAIKSDQCAVPCALYKVEDMIVQAIRLLSNDRGGFGDVKRHNSLQYT